jgi:hypothetical protein
MKLYYRFWITSINNHLRSHGESSGWKFISVFFVSHLMGISLWAIFAWMQYFQILKIEYIEIAIFPGEMLNGVFSFFLTFNAVFFIVNYFLIFWKNRYIELNEKYEEISKRTLVIILLITTLFPFFTFAIISLMNLQL